jgi:hypothetical protein
VRLVLIAPDRRTLVLVHLFTVNVQNSADSTSCPGLLGVDPASGGGAGPPLAWLVREQPVGVHIPLRITRAPRRLLLRSGAVPGKAAPFVVDHIAVDRNSSARESRVCRPASG